MKDESRAAKACEPRQVREEAAVSSPLRATRECLSGAGWLGDIAEIITREGARHFCYAEVGCKDDLPLFFFFFFFFF